MTLKSMLLCGLISLGAASQAEAACRCLCVDGQMQPICERMTDIPPICPLMQCPLGRSVQIAPLNTPVLPPVGTSECHPSWICDRSRKCWWEQLCH